MFLIILINPPHSVCDSQKEIFNKNVENYLLIDPAKKKVIKKNRFTVYLDHCRYDGKMGSCFDFFQTLKSLTRELKTVSSQCVGPLGGQPEVRKAIWDGAALMVRLAWGEEPPSTFVERVGWLSEAEVALFCQIKTQATRAFGEKQWTDFREKHFKTLPKADSLSRNEAWSRMLFSVNCTKYP